jgi:hypothetical protein
MSLLCPYEFPKKSWCRPALPGRVVLWLPPGQVLPVGFAPWFRSSGGVLVQAQSYAGGVALLLSAPAWVLVALCESVPPPISHGSRTAGVLLTW